MQPSAVLMSGSPQLHAIHRHSHSRISFGLARHGVTSEAQSPFWRIEESIYEEKSRLASKPVAEVLLWHVCLRPYKTSENERQVRQVQLFTCLSRCLQARASNRAGLVHQQSATRASIWYAHLAGYTTAMLCCASLMVFPLYKANPLDLGRCRKNSRKILYQRVLEE